MAYNVFMIMKAYSIRSVVRRADGIQDDSTLGVVLDACWHGYVAAGMSWILHILPIEVLNSCCSGF